MMASNSVGTNQLENDSVTDAKISNLSQQTILQQEL